MKITINKSAKRVLSIALALAMVVGTLFTANVGANIVTNAETAPIAEGTIDRLEGSDTVLADNGETGADWDNAIIIDSAEEFVYLTKTAGDATIGKYYKVANGIAGFILSNSDLDLDGTLADNLDKIKAGGKTHSGENAFQGHFDGNGVTVYGALIDGGVDSAGVFPIIKNTVTIKNINVKLSYFKAKYYAAGIVGYHSAVATAFAANAPKHTVTIENCSVEETHVEITNATWGGGAGAIMGRGNSAPSWKESEKDVDGNGDGDKSDTIYVDTPYTIKNCYMNFKAENLVSTAASTNQVTRGGIVGACGSNSLSASDCIVVGLTPYSTNLNTTGNGNEVQHAGLSSHFTNIYTDTGALKVKIGGTHAEQDYTGRIFILTKEQMTGDAAVANMNLGWFSTWMPGEDGQYPSIAKPGAESDVDFWSGSAASGFESGTGTKDDPYIIKTADQLYLALSTITYTTSKEGDLAVETSESVAGGYQSSRILKQESQTVYMPVYTPYYYKVADGVRAFYMNNIYSNETLEGAKAMGDSSNKKDWKPGKSFVGHLDGNGVTIYGMYNSAGQGLIHKLDGSAEVKNINFDACYTTGSGNVALLTTNLGTYYNDSTIINVANISVRNSYMATTRNITVNARTDSSGCYDHDPGSAGIISTSYTCEKITVSNCLYDGYSCERAIGANSDAAISINMIGGIYSGSSSANNFTLNGCVSLGAPAVNEVYVSGKEVFYNRYDANQGYPVHFYNSYSDVPLNAITTTYPDKYDKLKDIVRIDEAADSYEMYDMPKLAWSNWALTSVDNDSRIIPMPTVNTADEIFGSYISVIGAEAKTGKFAGTGPYQNGTNPYAYTLKGSGTEADPYIIETAAQLARAIATGGMNLYDKLYYKLGNDIDLSGGSWITQDPVSTSSAVYTYTPFKGTLDGDGHTVYGLTAGDSASAGLIPVLEGGTVKNLHIRNATVVSGEYAGALVGWMYGGSVTGCSVENALISSAGGYGDSEVYIVYNDDPTTMDEYGIVSDCYYIGKDKDGNDTAIYIVDHNEDQGIIKATADDIKENFDADKWYIGGKEGSVPRLKAQAEKMDCADVDGDGIGSGYTSNDLIALRKNLLKNSDYKYIFGDVSRNGVINIADLAVLKRTMAKDYGSTLTDSFFANIQAGSIKIYYGENDNYDAARKVELYLEKLTGADVQKVVSSSKGTVTGANSDKTKVYLHAGDLVGTPDGELEIIVGNIDNYSAYAANTVATAANTYAVTYDADKKVVWLQGANFTAVEQAAINFTGGGKDKNGNLIPGCAVQGDVVYTCGSTVLEDYKKPVTVTLDTDYDGSIADTSDGGAKVTTLYYAWGDEFEEDTLNTYNWEHNTQQTESQNGSTGSYNNLEMAPIKDMGKVITVENGRLSMKRGHDRNLLDGDVSYNGVVGSVALDVTPGEDNGYTEWSDSANKNLPVIDSDGSDQYFTSGKITTARGMLYKQGYIEFQGQLPADGHAFPAWWLMGRPAQTQTNSGYDNSLYGKVYKFNQNWDGVTNTWDKTNLDTFKYQIPSAIYEIDMIEVMQHVDRHYLKQENTGFLASGSYHNDDYKSYKGAVYYNMLNSTVHKWWNNGVTENNADGYLRIANWDDYTISSPIASGDFATTSTDGSWIHNIGSTQYDFGTPTLKYESMFGLSDYTYYNTKNFDQTSHDKLTATRKYGFSWHTNGVNGFEATLYIYNTAGTAVEATVPIASGMSDYKSFKDGNKNAETSGAIGTVDDGAYKNVYSDAKVFNQYMYILFDNKYYSSSDNISGNNMFTDLLTSMGLKSFEIDYVRVYQEDSKRDIVTPETEAFNNANHFGY